MRRSLLPATLLFATITAARSSYAEPADPIAKQRAEQPFKEGLALHAAGNDVAALAKFEEAHRIFPSGNVLFNVARAEQLLHRDVLALRHFRECLKDPNLGPENRRSADEHIETLAKRTGHLVIGAPAGASVKVDGAEVAQGAVIDVNPGKHTIVASLGAGTKIFVVDAPAGVTLPVSIAFEPPAQLSSKEDVSAGATTEPPPPSGGKGPPVRWIVAGAAGAIGLAGVGVGIGFLLAHGSSADDAEAMRTSTPGNVCADRASPSCQAYTDKLDTASSQGTTSTVGFVVGGVGLAVSAAAMLWPRASAASQHIVPLAGPKTAGAAFVTSF